MSQDSLPSRRLLRTQISFTLFGACRWSGLLSHTSSFGDLFAEFIIALQVTANCVTQTGEVVIDMEHFVLIVSRDEIMDVLIS